MKNLPLWILVGLVAIITFVEIGGFREKWEPHEMMEQEYDKDSALREHCRDRCLRCRGVRSSNNEAPAMGGMDHCDDGSRLLWWRQRQVIRRQYDILITRKLSIQLVSSSQKGRVLELKKLAQAIITAQEKEIAWWCRSGQKTGIIRLWLRPIRIWWVTGRSSQGKLSILGSFRAWLCTMNELYRWQNHFWKLDARKEVSDFARDVIRVQSSEISQMKLMLGDAYDDAPQ
jgi:hypothetical protein